MSNVAIYLIIMLAVAAAIVLACVFAYNRRMDRITRRSDLINLFCIANLCESLACPIGQIWSRSLRSDGPSKCREMARITG